MNYQEALETIGKTYTDDCQHIEDWEEYELLQELIEEHQKNLPYISTLEMILKETDKALESACQILANCKCFKSCPFGKNCIDKDCTNENVWKEYFMKESEKENDK